MSLAVVTRSCRALVALAALAALAACSGGAATQVNQVSTPPGDSAANYTGPAPANADVQAFKSAFWQNVIPTDRCGGCHHQGGQSPMFARTDDVNLAYQAAGPLVNLTNPSQSSFVLKVGGGHNCWVADPSACAATLLVWIQNWIGAGASSVSQVTLVAPPVQSAGGGKQFPPPVPPAYSSSVFPLLTQFCSGCHTPSSASAQQPYFADASNPVGSYIAAQPKINLATPNLSRFYQRLATDLHHCWSTTGPGGPPDCVGSSNAMLAALTSFANSIPVTPIDPTLVVSNAVTLTQGTIAAGGSRYDANVIAEYMFETGQGSTAYDTSGVTPEADLTLYGNVTWDSSWGIVIGQGGSAQASTSSSQKLAAMIQSSGEYSIEAWVAPANVTQTNAWMVSYSGSNTTRNATLGQAVTQYEGFARSSVTDTNGMPPLVTTTANGAAQAALQHVVLTYDPVNGQKLYVNGIYTGDLDPSKGGTLANWDSTFALVLGNETTGQRQWQGEIKFVAIHNIALTPAQIQQNFAAGVGQKYFLLFGVSSLLGAPANSMYILFQASQYDNYSYLFNQPKFISLNPNATVPANLPISGIRIGVNGQLAPAGQSFATLSASIGGSNYTAANGQLLSNLGTVIPVQLGAANDLFFLSFDQLGSHVHAFVDPPGVPTPPVPNNTPQADYGVMTFERFNNTLSHITGVAITDPVVQPVYLASQQSLPAGPQMAAFVSSQQTAMSSLANAYCREMLANQGLRDTFFGSGIESSLNLTANPALQGAALRQTIETALATNAVGSNVSAASSTAIVGETDALLQRIAGTAVNGLPAISVNATVSQATAAACTAALSSAAVTVQ